MLYLSQSNFIFLLEKNTWSKFVNDAFYRRFFLFFLFVCFQINVAYPQIDNRLYATTLYEEDSHLFAISDMACSNEISNDGFSLEALHISSTTKIGDSSFGKHHNPSLLNVAQSPTSKLRQGFFNKVLDYFYQQIASDLSRVGIESPKFLATELLTPNLLFDVAVSNTSPSGTEQFCYKVRYRCASITEHCFNSQITMELPPSMEITNLPSNFGNIASVNESGNIVTLDLASPTSAGAPAGALAAGSAGIIKICAEFKCENEAGVTAGSTVNFASDPVFSVTGGSVTATAPDVTVPTLATCDVVLPPPPPNSLEKINSSFVAYYYGFPGHFVGWRLRGAAHTTAYSVIDTFPSGFLLSDIDIDVGHTLDCDCGSGYVQILDGNVSSQNSLRINIFNGLVAGDIINDVNGNPTDCIVGTFTATNGGTKKYIMNTVVMRLNIDANTTFDENFLMYVDEDTPCGSHQNIAHSSIPSTFPPDAHSVSIYCSGKKLSTLATCAQTIGSSSVTSKNDVNINFPYLNVDPLDAQLEVSVYNEINSTTNIEGYVVEFDLEDYQYFSTDPDNPNYWVITELPNNVAIDPDCFNPIFEIMYDANGDQDKLKWTFPTTCILEGGAQAPSSNVSNSSTQRPVIHFSVRYNLEEPLGNQVDINAKVYLRDSTEFGNGNTEVLSSSAVRCPLPTGSSVNSAKYVKGALDQNFSRYPIIANTNLNGDGEYELFIYQHGFDQISDVHMADILPYIGDTDMLSSNIARGSEWSMELSQAITVERFKVGSGLVNASGDLGIDGVYYSTSTNPCYLTTTGNINVSGSEGASPGCGAFATGGSATGARSFGFHWSNAGDPLLFGEYIKISLNVEQLNGEADMTDLEVAWNSFVYSTVNTDGDTLTSQPIKVGLKMIDESAFASIGNSIWKDLNANGIQDTGEEGIAGVTMALFHSDGTPVSDTTIIGSSTTVIPRTTVSTDSLGFFCFLGLTPGAGYIIRLNDAANYTGSGPLSVYELTLANQGTNDDKDSDAEIGNAGGLFTDNYPEIVGIIAPAAGEKSENQDFGFTQLGTICGKAFIDEDLEGDEDSTEPVQENIIVIAKNLSGVEVARDTTDNSGFYSLTLVPGSYNLTIDTSLVSGYTFTAANATGEDMFDSDVNGSGIIGPIILLECGDIQCDNDIGLRVSPPNPGAIKGTIWDELTKDGLRTSGEEGVSGITVYLLDAGGFVLSSALTDANGNYEFSGFESGVNYKVSVVPVLGISFTTPQDAGTDDTIDSDVDPSSGETALIAVGADQCIEDVDAGICGLYSIGNLVFEDANNNGLSDNGEGIFSGISVYLYDNTTMTYIDTTVTDGNGKYVFTNLNIGNYIVEVEIPAGGFQSSIDIASTTTPNSTDSDDNGNGIANSGNVQSSIISIVAGGGSSGDANWTESDHGQPINSMIDITSNPKAYYTVDFGFYLAPPCINPTVTAYALPPSCTNGVPNNDGYLTITEAINGDRYHFSEGNTFDGFVGSLPLTYNNATSFGTFPEETSADLSNPTGSQDYTIRVYNGSSDCFTDYTVTMQEQDCNTSCDCTETIYLNEPTTGGAVHKFAINEADSTLIEIGSPWFDNAVEMEGLVSPHGLGVDLNGFLYIGEHFETGYEIRKFTCDGEIFPESEFAITTTGQTNIVTVGNKLYYNQRNGASEIIEYDLCSGVETGSVSLCDNPDNRFDWGFYYDKNTEIFYSVGSANLNTQNYFWYYTMDDFLSPDCVESTPLSAEFPTTNSKIRGVTTDLDGNVYIVVQEDANIANSPSYVLKFGMAPTFTYLATSSFDSVADGIGFNMAIGIVYSETTGKLYVSTGSPVDDCIAEFDTDLNYLGTAVPAPGTSDNGKGIAIQKECCPIPSRQTIEETYCMASVGEKLFLNEVFPCDGAICGAPWEGSISNTGVTYDACDQSITITAANSCATFTKQGSNTQCGAFDLTFNIEVLDIIAPVIAGDTLTCANGNDPVAFTITTPASGSGIINYRWQSSTTDCTTGFTDIAGAPTDATLYDPPAINQETYYRVITDVNGSCSSGMCADTSNCVTLTPELPCSSCPTITNPTPAQSICEGQNITSLEVSTDATSSIDFVYFTTAQTGNSMYSGGTSLGVATPSGGTATINNVSFPTTGVYYVYAILSPTPADGACRPFQEIQVTLSALPDITYSLTDTLVCAETDAIPILSGSEIGINYQLRNDSDDSPIGNPVAGTGNPISFTIYNLMPVGTYTYNVLATNSTAGCNAEITDKAIIEVEGCDFQDYLPTCENPPCHFISTDLYIGSSVSSEASTMGSVNADMDDDDGILLPNNIRPGITIRFPTTIYNNTGQTAYLTGWIDWNGDQDFDDPGEQIANEMYDYATYNGSFQIPITIAIPSDAVQGQNIAVRYRLSTVSADINSPCGFTACAGDGEIEDYLIMIECPPTVCLPVGVIINRN